MPTAEEILRDLQASASIQQEQAVRDIREIDEVTGDQFQDWSENKQTLLDTVGPQAADVIATLAGHLEGGPTVLNHIGRHPEIAKKLLGMNQTAAANYIGRLRDQLIPSANDDAGDGVPSFRKAHRKGDRYSTSDNVSDAQFEKSFRHKYGYDNRHGIDWSKFRNR